MPATWHDVIFRRLLEELRAALAPFVLQRVENRFGVNWWAQGVEPLLDAQDRSRARAFNGTKEEWFKARDALFFLRYIGNGQAWKELFRTDFGQTGAEAYLLELRRDRNVFEHDPVLRPLTKDKLLRAIETAALLLDSFGLANAARNIRGLSKDGDTTPPIITEDNTKRGKIFQERAKRALSQWLQVEFQTEVELPVGTPPKLHKFDLASEDRVYVGEAKAFTWTRGGNVPSAKITTLKEAAQYLRELPSTTKPFIIVLQSLHPRNGESLAAYFARLNHHLIGNVTIVELDSNDNLQIVRGAL